MKKIIFLCMLNLLFTAGVLYEVWHLSLKDLSDVNYISNINDKNLIINELESGFIDYNGNKITDSENMFLTDFLACQSEDVFSYNGGNLLGVSYYDGNKEFLFLTTVYTDYSFKVPYDKNIKFMRLIFSSKKIKLYTGSSNVQQDDYCVVPQLRIKKSNLDENFNYYDKLFLKSPNGNEWELTVDNNGELKINFPFTKHFTIIGKSCSDEDFLMATSHDPDSNNYIFVMSANGKIKWHKKVSVYAYNFRKIEYEDGTIRYAYIDCYKKTEGSSNIYHAKLVLMDDKFNVLRDDIIGLNHGSVKEGNNFLDVHDYKIINDNHFILMISTIENVDNIPGYEGENVTVLNQVVQEQKDGQVIMQWESIDYPELYSAAVDFKSYDSFEERAKLHSFNYAKDPGPEGFDYCHFNSISIDPKNLDILISTRYCGLIKIDRQTAKIKWIMGKKYNDIAGISPEQLGLFHHDAHYYDDGSFSLFDNNGGKNQTSRILHYLIDEDNKKMLKYLEFETNVRHYAMGGTRLLDEETQTYFTVYGYVPPPHDFLYEEKNYKNNVVNMKIILNEENVMYRVFRGVEKTPTQKVINQ